MLGALPPRPPAHPPEPKELPPAGRRRLPDGRRPDHLWSVLHHEQRERREDSPQPRRALSREEQRRESRSLPSRPELDLQKELPYPGYPAQLPPLWAAPNDWDLKAQLRPRLLDSGAEAKEFVERRLESALTEQRSELARRFASYEQTEKHFKDWVQREHEQLHSQLQQLRVSVSETGQQQQRLVGNLSAQTQKQDLRLQDLEGQMAQAAAQVQGLMSAVSAGALNAGGNGGGTGEAAGAAAVAASASANMEVLRAGLEREASARVALGAETAEQLKQLSDMVFELSNRQQQQQASAQQHFQQNAVQEEKDAARYEQRVAALEPPLLQMREEMEEMRKMLYKCGADCAKRLEESEELLQKRVGGVQEAALNAARELWEEHQGVVMECKSSLSALQQILDSKDKIALQLRSLQQQQREEDKQEFWSQLQIRHEQLQAKLVETERNLFQEQSSRIEEHQRTEGVISRLGLALEKAQAAWLKDSAKLTEELHEAKRDFSIEMDGESRGVARRLAQGLEEQRRAMDELERKIAGAKTELSSLTERCESNARVQQQELRDSEGRVLRQLGDVQTMQSGRTQQAVFDLKAALGQLEQATTQRCSSLQKGQDELEARAMSALSSLEARTLQKIQDVSDLEREKSRSELSRAVEEERGERQRGEEELRSEQVRHVERIREQVDEAKKELAEDVQTAEERLLKRLEEQVNLERSKTREQIEGFVEEERSERLKAEADRLTTLQKRLQAHEELTLNRFAEQAARLPVELETVRQRLESQALRDKQELQKEVSDFVQEERQRSEVLLAQVHDLAGEYQSLAEEVQRHQTATEQRLAGEAAALAAQLGVSSAALTAQMARLAEMQDAKAMEIQQDLGRVSDELDKMNGELLKLIDDESQQVKENHRAVDSRITTLEMAFTARTAALGEADAQLEQRLDDLASSQGQAMMNLQEVMASNTEKIAEHGDMIEAVKAHGIEVQQTTEKYKEEAGKAMEAVREDAMGAVQAVQTESREAIGKLEGELNEAKSEQGQLKEKLELLQKSGEDFQKALSAEEQRARRAEETLEGQLAEATKARVVLSEKVDEVQKKAEKAEAEAKSEQGQLKEKLELLELSSDDFQKALSAEEQRARLAEETLEAQLVEATKVSAALTEKVDEVQKTAEKAEAEAKSEQGQLKEKLELLQKSDEDFQKAQLAEATKTSAALTEKVEELQKKAEKAEAEAKSEQGQLKEKLELLQLSDEDFQKALSAEEQRARRAEETLEVQLAEATKARVALSEKVEEAQKKAEKAEAEAAVAQSSLAEASAKSEAESKAADESLEAELGKLKKDSEEEKKAQLERLAALEQQMLHMEQTEKEAMEKGAGSQKEIEQNKADLEDLKKQLAEAQSRDVELQRNQEGQSKLAQEMQQRQEAALEDVKKLQQKLEELSGTKSDEMLQSCQAEVTILQEKLDQELGSVRLRMEGGFRALLQRMESERWVREQVDVVADGVSNSFLRLLDKSTEKLKERVDKLEKEPE